MFRERTRLAGWFRRHAETIFSSIGTGGGGFREKSAIARTRSPARETRALPSMLFCQLVQIFNKRHRRPVEVLDFRVRGFDDVIFVRRMRAAAVTESEMSRREI